MSTIQRSSEPLIKPRSGWDSPLNSASDAQTVRFCTERGLTDVSCGVCSVAKRQLPASMGWGPSFPVNKMYLVAIWCCVFAISATRMRQRTEKRHNRGAFPLPRDRSQPIGRWQWPAPSNPGMILALGGPTVERPAQPPERSCHLKPEPRAVGSIRKPIVTREQRKANGLRQPASRALVRPAGRLRVPGSCRRSSRTVRSNSGENRAMLGLTQRVLA